MSSVRRSSPRRWIDVSLGGSGTWRRLFTNLCLLVIGIDFAYMEIYRASQPGREPNGNLGAAVSDMAIPEALYREALHNRGQAVFTDFHAYEGFLAEHGLADGVLIKRVRSLTGEHLYDAFSDLHDRDTFSSLITSLPGLSGEPADEKTGHRHIYVHHLAENVLASRKAAEEAYFSGAFSFSRSRTASRVKYASPAAVEPGRTGAGGSRGPE